MTTALDRIIDYKRDEVSELKSRTSFEDIHRKAIAAPAVRGFIKRLDTIADKGQNALICELKRKSPSAGEILPGADPLKIAREYEKGGAACLSILTDGPSFGGHLRDLEAARQAVSLPLLRKDFMIDPIQVVEARAHGADCILLILSALSDAQALELQSAAHSYDLDVLTEVHDEEELERAVALKSQLVGVNNRNLKEMTTDLAVSERLSARIPDHRLVSESGVKNAADIARLRCSGFRRFLIGESLMKETNRENAVSTLVNTIND